MTFTMEIWSRRCIAKHEAEVDRDEHDAWCEWRATGFFLCNCRARRRKASGLTDPPHMIFQAPECSHCYGACDHDGDGWVCARCSVSFGDQYETPGEFNDDHGDLTADLAKWEARHAETNR